MAHDKHLAQAWQGMQRDGAGARRCDRATGRTGPIWAFSRGAGAQTRELGLLARSRIAPQKVLISTTYEGGPAVSIFSFGQGLGLNWLDVFLGTYQGSR